jgi:hypothetical protein
VRPIQNHHTRSIGDAGYSSYYTQPVPPMKTAGSAPVIEQENDSTSSRASRALWLYKNCTLSDVTCGNCMHINRLAMCTGIKKLNRNNGI